MDDSFYYEVLKERKRQLSAIKKAVDKTDVDAYRKAFCRNLRNIMKERNMTITDASKVLGVSYSTVHYWLNGKKYPRPDKIKKLAEFLNVSTAELTGELDSANDNIDELREVMRERPELKILFDLSQKADTRDIEAAIQMLTALTKDKE